LEEVVVPLEMLVVLPERPVVLLKILVVLLERIVVEELVVEGVPQPLGGQLKCFVVPVVEVVDDVAPVNVVGILPCVSEIVLLTDELLLPAW
jgi:hypothetical protein